MAVLTSQKINSYYERFKNIDVTFSKEIIQVTGMITGQIYLKCMSDFWPCVVQSASFQGAKVISNIKSGILAKLRQTSNSVSLKFCFKNEDEDGPLTFFVSARSSGYVPFGDSPDMGLFTLQFAQRPPDAFIGIMGRLLEANVNSSKRRDERILIAADSQRKLALVSKETAVFIQGVPRRCILRDIAFAGAKLIILGVAKFLEGREASLRIDFDDPRTSYLLKGTFGRLEPVEGRKDLVAAVLAFDEALVPMGYKLRLNDYLGQIRPEGHVEHGDSHAEAHESRQEGSGESPEEKPLPSVSEEVMGKPDARQGKTAGNG